MIGVWSDKDSFSYKKSRREKDKCEQVLIEEKFIGSFSLIIIRERIFIDVVN